MKKFFIFFIFALLAVSLVSASWFSDMFGGITGNVIDDGTNFIDTAKCVDSDGGIFAKTAGVVIYYGWTAKTYPDKCGGRAFTLYGSDGKAMRVYPSIKEYYCENGVKSQVMDASTGLPEGYCVSEKVEVEGKPFVSAKWVPNQPVCIKLTNGVKLETGKTYISGCGTGEDKNKFIIFSCKEDGTHAKDVKDCTTADGFGKCAPQGCIGACTETDAENNKDVPGTVTVNGKEYKDTCYSTKQYVMQYKCVNGQKLTVPYGEHGWQPCGTNRECVLSENGEGYCKDKYAGVATIETLTARIELLEGLIVALSNRITALENPLTEETETVSNNFGRTDCTEANQWCEGADVNHDGTVDDSDLSTALSA